ncbi:DUF1360 domain-containing protein [Peribacillus sp. SCS-37]|uniref:DUF1360 domain-containing protein n=1 Tax=Paraperibacillus esterisolvens TaxID=3115296 RepID=UPI003906AF2C
MNVNFLLIFLLGLAAFRLTRLLVYDKITSFIRAPFFDEITEKDEQGNDEVYIIPKNAGIRKFFGELLSCYWCTGIWSSAIVLALHFFYPEIGNPIILILAISAIASFLETINLKLLG